MSPVEVRAQSWIHEDGSFGPYYRHGCNCCGCPTLSSGHSEIEGPTWPQVCVLCEWQNADPEDPSRTDDTLTLEQARANVQRFSWMYDPADLPAWMPTAPSRAELQARAALRDIYVEIDAEPEGPRFIDLWEVALGAEETLRTIVRAREAADSESDSEALRELSDDDLEEYTP